MCEVLLPDGTPHPSNARATILDDPGAWFGFEQEYFPHAQPAGRWAFPPRVSPGRRVPTTRAWATATWATWPARSSRSTWTCAWTRASTTRASTPRWPRASGSSRSSARAAGAPPTRCGWRATSWRGWARSTTWTSNGTASPSGATGTAAACTRNFSTEYLREHGGKEYFEALMGAFDKYKNEHIAVYGPDNHLRLTGLHETQSIDKFNYGVANRGASDPHPPQLRQPGLQGLPGGPPAQLGRRPLQDRQPHPPDRRHRPHGLRRTITTNRNHPQPRRCLSPEGSAFCFSLPQRYTIKAASVLGRQVL